MNKILIVDNSDIIRNVLKDFFNTKRIFQVYEANNLSQMKELMSVHKFYACISKIELSDSSQGEHFEVLSTEDIPTIILTSKHDDEISALLSLSNIIGYVQKDSLVGLESIYNLIELMTFLEEQEILIVDDSAVILSKIESLLKCLLVKVHLAKSGEEALKILKQNSNISLVISDYSMGQMDGLELITLIKNEKAFISLPILVMTSFNDPELKIKLYKKGISDFLVKPILPEELRAKVINIYSGMKQLNEIKAFYKFFDNNVISSSTDTKGNITNASKAFCEITGYSKDELIGRSHNIVRHPDMPSSVFKEMWETIQTGKTWNGEVKNLRKDGSSYWVKVLIEPEIGRTGKIKGYTSIRQDITDKKKIYELSITDGLTSLYNRRYFNEMMDKILTDEARNNEYLSFVLLDIDNFKKYNDNYGHLVGDDVLIRISKSLKATFKRETDMVFRLGGEEFGVLFFVKEQGDILKLANEARVNIEKLKIEHKASQNGVVTASFGASAINLKNGNYKLDEIYKKTDEALYEAKENGRNQVKIVKISSE